jgi:hypothetical protein
VKLKESCGAKLPESKIPERDPGTPLVTVCVTASLFVHLRVVPTATVLVPAENDIFCMKISFVPGVPSGGLVEESFLLQPLKTSNKKTDKKMIDNEKNGDLLRNSERCIIVFL